MSADDRSREAEAIQFLDTLPDAAAAVLIGGYATAAYGPPRFSVDVDVVCPITTLAATGTWLESVGWSVRRTLEVPRADQRWVKFRVHRGAMSADLYFGGLRGRDRGEVVDYDWIAARPTVTKLRLLSGSTSTLIRVARPEAIWVLKLLAGRAQDLTDLFAMRMQPIDLEEVRMKLNDVEGIHGQDFVASLKAKLADQKTFRDALSRRELGSPKDARNVADWDAFRTLVQSILG